MAIGETFSLFEDSLNTDSLNEASIIEALNEKALDEKALDGKALDGRALEEMVLLKKALLKKALLKKALLKKALLKKTVVDSSSEVVRDQAGAASPASIGSDTNYLNVHQAELPLGLQGMSELISDEQRQVEQLEIPISTVISARISRAISQSISQSIATPFSRSNVVSFKDTNHQVATQHSVAQGKTPGLYVANMPHSQNDLSDVLEKSADIEGSDMMPVRCINRTKPSPTPDIENSARHFEAAMTLAQQLRSKQKPARQEQSLNEIVASSIDPFHSEKAYPEKVSSEKHVSEKNGTEKNSSENNSSKKKSATRHGNAQTCDLRQRCIDDLEESRRFVKRSKESLVGITKRPQTTVADKKDHQQIGYQRPLLGLAPTDSAQGVNIAVIRPSVQKKIRVNVKKQEQQKRKQAGILICRHLVAALKIQAAHDQNAITN
ncbi:hypothetical protein N9P41_01280 [Pseudomonadales bacterium]|nr:hypothetical protein [Pseudomonadales bacterium]